MVIFNSADGTALDRFLADAYSRFVNDITAILNIEAGLREVTIGTSHADLVQDLRGALDVSAGLSAVKAAAKEPSEGTGAGVARHVGPETLSAATTRATKTLNARYQLRRRLSAGGMGSVWLAEDLQLKRLVAVKELTPYPGESGAAEYRKRAVREAQALARMNHPSITRVYDVLLVDQDPWIVMEYIQGRSLTSFIAEQPLDDWQIAKIGIPVAGGLAAIHAAGIVHRDVKPQNILVAEDGSVFLVDFGIADILGEDSADRPDQIVGTTEFMAPERFLGGRADPAADLWSLGVTFFCALEGYSPFLRTTHEGTLRAILNEPPPRLTREGTLADLVYDLLDKDPSRRPSAPDVARTLQSISRESTAAERERTRPPEQATMPEPSSDPLVLLPLEEASGLLLRLDGPTAAALLSTTTPTRAAQILATLQPRVAAALIQTMSAPRPQVAASVLQQLPATSAGHALDYINPEALTSILAALPLVAAAQIVGHADPVTAGMAMKALPAEIAVELIRAMHARQAAIALASRNPLTVAILLSASEETKDHVLGHLEPPFRAQVLRHL